MFDPRKVLPLLAATLLWATPVPMLAQSTTDAELTEEEMSNLFLKQKTRGLVIAPASQGSGEASDTSAAAVTEVRADAIPRDEQVNVNITFDFDSAALRADQRPKLVSLCNAVRAADVQTLRIVGHTDAAGTAEYNERLSRLRAEEVKRVLEADCDLPGTVMEAIGVGEQFPYDPDNPRADVNRRVEFQALG